MTISKPLLVLLTLGFALAGNVQRIDARTRSEAQQQYTENLWTYITSGSNHYTTWSLASTPVEFNFGPPSDATSKSYLNNQAASTPTLPHNSVVVTEHRSANQGSLAAVTVFVKSAPGFNAHTDDWYWAHYLPNGIAIDSSSDQRVFGKRGFVTFPVEGRLWIFRSNSELLSDFVANGELAKHVIRPGMGPAGMTLKAPDTETLSEYICKKNGFITKIVDGRVWVFRAASPELENFLADSTLAKHVIRPGVGPNGMTVKSPDMITVDAYLTAKDGFTTKVVDGRLWVFRQDAPELAAFNRDGELAKHVIRPGAGPLGMTLKAPDDGTILEYLTVQTGFFTQIVDGRLWVFKLGSDELAEFQSIGEPAKYVIRPTAGPLGMTLKGPDSNTIDTYLRFAVQ